MSKKEENNRDHSMIVWARVDGIINLILQNPRYLQKKRSGELTKLVLEKLKNEFDVDLSERTAQRYVKEAKAEIRRISASKLEKKKEYAVLTRHALASRAEKNEDYKTVLAIYKDIAELEGLYPEKNMKVKGELTLKNIDMSKLSDRQLEKLKSGIPVELVLAEGE